MVLIRESRQSDNHALAQLMGELGYPTSAESMRKRMKAIESNPMNGTFIAEMDNLIKPERAAAHEFYKSKGYDINGYRFLKKL
ncbi:hypothetical protein OB236_18045 [Paenibacillus sp. WQ 127069]|uniref:N-acetyltransferase n=1 Tax=Paenibacillus baimaensis TaxID=2982185 RepID=A0ABT2UJ12_9BACL|nr:hypothetical protein [Paenibacillus sp. WQ 127069]MCU6794006.1 hypothetical protein [Paenibacillus sp. WQ 127069]